MGHRADGARLHALAQKLGALAEGQTQRRLTGPVVEEAPQRVASAAGVLMFDGWQVRQRGPGWGQPKTQNPLVAWHELKTGVFCLHEQAARKYGGMLTDKVVVGWQGEPLELGRRLHQAACEPELGPARESLVVSDVAPWLRTVAGLKTSRRQAGEVIRREQNYFAGHARRLNYRAAARRGWPIGSGAVESACRQRQVRFKRSGQFWTPHGLRHLSAPIEARQNGHGHALWNH